MKQLRQELLLVHDGVHTSLGDDPGFEHFFHRKQFSLLFMRDLPNFTKPTSADDILKLKISLASFCKNGVKNQNCTYS